VGPEPPAAQPLPRLSIVVPAFNEEAILDARIRMISETLRGLGITHEIILVDDGSRDRTGEIADRLAREVPFFQVHHQVNQGIGSAFRTGLRASCGQYVVLWPVDMPCRTGDLQPYIECLGRASVIVGCRRRREGYNPLMLMNAWLYPRIVFGLFGLRLRDVNWICLYNGPMLRDIRLTQSGIPMLTEILVRLRDRGATFLEVDVEMTARASGVPSAARLRVMCNTLLGLLQLWRKWRSEKERAL
jgi:glycosyltransferase involved in cell wall biosynthesis